MARKKKQIYLVQVNNSFGRNAFLPYSVGMLWSYCKENDAIADAYELGQFLYLRRGIEQDIAELDAPDVVGFSCYVWNWEYNKALAERIRSHFPDVLIVFGGPHVPNASSGFFDTHPYVDILVHNEAEISFAHILLENIKDKPVFESVRGVTVKMPGGRAQKTLPQERIANLETIPSPYLAGIFDDLLMNDFDFHASQETHRGCPYSCTFCDWGSAVYTKVRRFSGERIEHEIDWMAKKKIELLYNCDANFGIYKEDVEIVRYLVDTKVKQGFPKKIRAAYAKNSNERVFEISKILDNANMSKGVTLSLQSLDEGTLDVIKRKNIKFTDFAGWIQRYTESGMPTYTELIVGLPGETYASFTGGLEELLQAGQHQGLFMFPCMVLPNSELSETTYREKHRIEFQRVPVVPIHGSIGDDGIDEYYDLVVSTATMYRTDLQRALLIAWAIQAYHCMGLLQSAVRILCQVLGFGYLEIYDSLLKFAERNPNTIVGQELTIVKRNIQEMLDGAKIINILPDCGDINWPNDEATFLRVIQKKEVFYQDIELFMSEFVKNQADEGFIRDLIRFQSAIVLDPNSPRQTSVLSNWNFEELLTSDEPESIQNITKSKSPSKLTVSHEKAFCGDVETFAREIVWYGRKGGMAAGTTYSVLPARSVENQMT